jgi:hypothetical protein
MLTDTAEKVEQTSVSAVRTPVVLTDVTKRYGRAAVAIPELASAPVLGIEVGLRPGRPQVRLEAEQTGGMTVVHNYGHDSTGVFWSWGCAADVVALCGLG